MSVPIFSLGEFERATLALIAARADGTAPRPSQADEIYETFYEHARSLRQAQIDFLVKRHAVPVLALCEDGDHGGVALGTARVSFCGRGGQRFDFANDGDEAAVSAIVAVLRDRNDCPVDVVAWAPREGTLGTHFARAALIGEHEIDRPRFGEALPVHRTFLDWLRCGRNGLVVLDESRAWQLLYREELTAVDVEHGLELRKRLQPPSPRILVPATARQAA